MTRYELRCSDRRFLIDVERSGGDVRVKVDDKEYRVRLVKSGQPGHVEAYLDDKLVRASIVDERESSIILNIEGEMIAFEKPPTKVDQSRRADPRTAPEKDVLSAPMPGRIVAIAVRNGQQLKMGEPLLIIESMKMESVILADREAVVEEILVKRDDAIKRGQLLVRFAKEDLPA